MVEPPPQAPMHAGAGYAGGRRRPAPPDGPPWSAGPPGPHHHHHDHGGTTTAGALRRDAMLQHVLQRPPQRPGAREVLVVLVLLATVAFLPWSTRPGAADVEQELGTDADGAGYEEGDGRRGGGDSAWSASGGSVRHAARVLGPLVSLPDPPRAPPLALGDREWVVDGQLLRRAHELLQGAAAAPRGCSGAACSNGSEAAAGAAPAEAATTVADVQRWLGAVEAAAAGVNSTLRRLAFPLWWAAPFQSRSGEGGGCMWFDWLPLLAAAERVPVLGMHR